MEPHLSSVSFGFHADAQKFPTEPIGRHCSTSDRNQHKTSSALSADVRTSVLTCAMKADPSAALFDKFVAAHNKTDDGTVRQSLYAAVGNAPDKALRRRALDWALSDDVRSQDLIYLPMSVARLGKDGAESPNPAPVWVGNY